MDLIQMVIEQLGVSDGQARGGMGLILKLLKSQLEGTQFETIAQYLPMAAELMGAAPALSEGDSGGGLMGMIGKVLPFLGGGNKLGAMAQLAGGFSELDMESSQAAAFVPVLTGFLKEQGGEEVSDLVAGLLG